MAQSELIISPVGRWIGGSMTETVKTDHLNRPLDPDKYHYSVGIAFRKDDPATGAMLQAMAAHAYQEFAQAPHIQQLIGQYNFVPRSGFSWKVKDGDQPNAKGEINKNSVGCYVIYFSSNFVTKCADQTNAEIGNDNAAMTRGNFIQVAFTVAGNGNTDNTAGIYVNPQVYRFIAYGEPIVGGVDAATAFAGHDIPQQLPAGASLTPVATQMAVPQGNNPSGAPGQPPMVQGSSPGSPTTPPNTQPTTGYPSNVAPHPTFANGPQGGAAPAAPQPPMQQPGVPAAPGLPPQQ